MSLRAKLTVFTIVFFLLTGALIAGSFLIFNRLSATFDTQKSIVLEHGRYEDWKSAMGAVVIVAEGWAVTGEVKFQRRYKQKLKESSAFLNGLPESVRNKEEVKAIRADFDKMKEFASAIMSAKQPVGDIHVLFALRMLHDKERDMHEKLDVLRSESASGITNAIAQGERIERQMGFYLVVLFGLSSLAFISLIIFMKRIITALFDDLMKATEKISGGEMQYRIGSDRRDEFGVIAKRFDEMVEKLQTSQVSNEELYALTKNQLQKLTALYELITAVTSAMDIDEILGTVTSKITRLLDARGCIIRLLEGNILRIKSSYGLVEDLKEHMDLTIGSGIAGWVAKEGEPLLVEDVSEMPPEMRVPVINVKSVICVPLKVEDKVIGTLGIYDKAGSEGNILPFSADEMNTAATFASIAAVAIEKARGYESECLSKQEAVEAKKRMEILFDSVQGGIVTIGRDYKIISANRFVKRWTDMAVEEIAGRNAMDVFHDKEGICPHCVAKATFETGRINSITQLRGMNYTELTSYPVKDVTGDVIECIVFIEDITDRVLYHEEILSLYKEVVQTKGYLESLIENSADAIVTSDLNGNITSWNYGAERTFGYTADEAAGKFLLFVPQFLVDAEKGYIGKVKNGETLKDIETLRQRKDGAIIEVSLTLSPIKDTAGEVIGISGITRDISERKRVEKELIRRNQELSSLFFISPAMRGTLELDRLLRMILTAVTMSDGLGFNRSILFLIDEKEEVIRGAMGVGPASPDEAWKIWEKLSIEMKTLPGILHDIETGPLRKDSFLDRLSMGMEISLKDETILTRSVKEKKAINVRDVKEEPLADAVLIQQLGTQSYAVVPLVARDRVIGVLWVDNIFTRRLISDEDMKFLIGFSNQIASAVENARLFDQVARAEAELGNIFRSISDMVYITDKDCTIKNVNKAVVDRIGKSDGEIIGEKCYRIFHGMNEPFPECPHHKTLETMEAYIEEVKDSYLGGMFLTSVSPVFTTTGEFLGTVHVVRDVTELNTLREKLAATERMAALGEVAAKVAHEIRNPLVLVGGFAKRLEKKLDGNLKEYAGIIAKEVDRLERILHEILGFVKEARLMKEKVNVGELVDGMILLMQTQVRERGIKVLKEKGETPQIYVDTNRIREALLNIFNNAVQALAIHGTITIKTYTAGSSAVIEISDTGSGIEEKDLPFIFNPFYTTKLSGTGLGLAITKRIIEEHKGKIEVDSAPGKGTTFRVFLPG
ncbi:MAG: PAS domain S-box protein [Thermodesulfovibrionales bacterium]|nr:PAS domain S-box protein [Thermodesulfovibrionales bacterium]